uniref:NPH3 domain-containing protein n=1 Tax=Oryza sativa subsp. japonica TaxID=39947 RepID=Q53WL4_ORYSJ|nr:unknown protein [Oryza sativa Japonica Group]
MDCQKLSREACAHAAQNDRLPVQTVVQVLYHEQRRLRAPSQPPSAAPSYAGGESPALSYRPTLSFNGAVVEHDECPMVIPMAMPRRRRGVGRCGRAHGYDGGGASWRREGGGRTGRAEGGERGGGEREGQQRGAAGHCSPPATGAPERERKRREWREYDRWARIRV